jgi:hypothetical protein
MVGLLQMIQEETRVGGLDSIVGLYDLGGEQRTKYKSDEQNEHRESVGGELSHRLSCPFQGEELEWRG